MINSISFVVGLQMCALLRDLTKLPKEYEGKLSIIKGDVLNIEDVKKTLEGQDGVIVVLGTRNDLGKSIFYNTVQPSIWGPGYPRLKQNSIGFIIFLHMILTIHSKVYHSEVFGLLAKG